MLADYRVAVSRRRTPFRPGDTSRCDGGRGPFSANARLSAPGRAFCPSNFGSQRALHDCCAIGSRSAWAMRVLVSVYERFTERFETADLTVTRSDRQCQIGNE